MILNIQVLPVLIWVGSWKLGEGSWKWCFDTSRANSTSLVTFEDGCWEMGDGRWEKEVGRRKLGEGSWEVVLRYFESYFDKLIMALSAMSLS